MEIEPLGDPDEAALEEHLSEEPVINLFLRGFLDTQPMDRGVWYGVRDGDRVVGTVLVIHGQLAVPWCPDLDAASALGAHIARRHPPCMMVGPRDQVDAVFEAWAPRVRPHRFYDQRLYTCQAPPPGPPVDGFRKAWATEWRTIAANAVEMELDDMGRDPSEEDPERHRAVVKDRIRQGRTLVLVREGRIVFQLNVGTSRPDGTQVGGTFVPRDLRGRGFSVLGMQEATRRLLRRFPRVTLHVNEANTPAVRCYERVGYVPYAPYRLLTVR